MLGANLGLLLYGEVSVMEGNETETENVTPINERQEKENETQNVIFEMEVQAVKEKETENRENEIRENNESDRVMLDL